MFKCKIADNEACPKNLDICCCYCEDKGSCNASCDGVDGDPAECSDLIKEEEQKTDLQVMQEVLPDKLQQVTDLMLQVKKAEAEISRIKDSLLKAMEENGIKKFENSKLSFTYVAPSKKKTFDKKKFQKEHPEINLEDFDKISDVKAFVRIAVK